MATGLSNRRSEGKASERDGRPSRSHPTCRRPVGSARPPTAAPRVLPATRRCGAEKDEAVAHAGRRRLRRARRRMPPSERFSGRAALARFTSRYLSRDSVHLSLALGPHLTPGCFFSLLSSGDAYTPGARHRCQGRRRRDGRTASASASGGACWSNGAKKHAPAVLATAAVCSARPVRPPGIVPSSPQRQTGSSLVGLVMGCRMARDRALASKWR